MQKVSVVTHTRIEAAKKRRDKIRLKAAKAWRKARGHTDFYAGLFDPAPFEFRVRVPKASIVKVVAVRKTAPRRTHHTVRSSKASGDSNEPEPEPERPLLQLFSFSSAAEILDCSPQTLRNKVRLGLIPAPIKTAVGPRFTQDQLRQITTPPTKPIPIPVPRRKVGRPRLASAGKGGAL